MSSRIATRAGEEERVTPLELFFDLVFVFALTQVTGLVSADPTWAGVAKGVVLLGVLWWAWAGYAWLTNTLNPDEGFVRIAMFGAMAALLVVSLAVPEAFDDDALVFAIAYGAVRAAHLVLYALAGRGDPALLGSVLRLVPGTVVGVGAITVAAFLDGHVQGAVWALGLAVDLAGPWLLRARGWRLSPGHFAERHALVLIIALGESIVALGVGAAGVPLGIGVAAAAILGVAVAAALWWAYFDVVAIVAERRLREARGAAQLGMARDSYSYLHLPMVAGIVLFAVGLKKTLANYGDALATVPAAMLCGGLALYFVAHVLFRLRNVHTWNKQRCVVAVALLALIPAATEMPAVATLGAAAALCAGLIAYEAIRFRTARERVRHAKA